MWYYASGGQQLGPVDDQALDQLARQGAIRADTLVWREGMASWQPYGSLMRPALPAPAYAPPAYTAPSYPQGPVFDYALWGTRAMGALIDWLFVIVMMFVLGGIGMLMFGSFVGLSSFDPTQLSNVSGTACCCAIMLMPIATILVGAYNKVYLLSTRGFTVGQGICKVKTVDALGNHLTMGKAFIRLLVQSGLSLIWFLTVLDHIFPLWDVRRQTLHDKAVDSYVINNPSGM